VIAEQTFDDGQQTRLLADVAGAVAWSPDVETTLRRVAELMVPRLADWCVIDVLDEKRDREMLGIELVPSGLGRCAGCDAEQHRCVARVRE